MDPPTGTPGRPRPAVAAVRLVLPILLLGCGSGAPGAGRLPPPLIGVEARYLQWRHDADRVRLLEALGTASTPDGVPGAAVRQRERASRDTLARVLAVVRAPETPGDSQAVRVMREVWNAESTAHESAGEAIQCPAVRAGLGSPAPAALARFSAETMACFERAAGRIVVDGDTLNRLAILGLLSEVEDRDRRRRLFLALGPVWQSVNGDNTPDSPFRAMRQAYAAAWGDSLSPIEQKAPAFGVTTARLEEWLEGALTRYRRLLPDTLVEPWDWYYLTGEASRRLSPRLPDVASLARVNADYFTSLGASPAALNIHYDLEPRPGKYPVAYTSFGGRHPVEPWVFTNYLVGGLDNLAELLHETGHAIHIAGIRTRPALLDWPDNDTYTEALADVPALELYEPRWQQRFLADSVPLAVGLRAKYAAIAFDMTWSLFELRAYRDPATDPNLLWVDLARRYLGIRPHPEWSWWAMRGQLIDAPGYLLNYALGAFIAADIRARLTVLDGGFGRDNPALYATLADALYRQGRSVPAREVLERFLGRPISADALLADLGRIVP